MEKLQKFFDSSAPKTFEPKKAAAAAERTPEESTSSGAGGRAQRLLDAHVEKQGTRRQRAAAARQRERQEQEQARVARGGTAHAAAELAPDSLEQLKLQLEVAQSLVEKNRHEQGRASERGANLGVDAETRSEDDAHGESQPQGASDAQEEEEQGQEDEEEKEEVALRLEVQAAQAKLDAFLAGREERRAERSRRRAAAAHSEASAGSGASVPVDMAESRAAGSADASERTAGSDVDTVEETCQAESPGELSQEAQEPAQTAPPEREARPKQQAGAGAGAGATGAKKDGMRKQQLGAMLGGLSAAQRDELRQKILEGHGYPPGL